MSDGVRRDRIPAGLLCPRTFTTGQVARICGTSARTVSKWVDSGRLKGHRLPGSEDRRVYESDVVAFLEAHKMQVPPDLTPPVTITFALRADALPGALHAADAVALGALLATRRIARAVVGDADGVAIARSALAAVRERHPAAALVLVLSEGTQAPACESDVTVLRQPLDLRAALSTVRTA